MKQLKLVLTMVSLVSGMLVMAQDSTARKELIGKYKFPAGSVVEEVIVLQDNGALMMNSTAGTSALELIKGDSFNIVSFNGVAVFKRNEMKKITGVHIDASGYVLEGVKDSTGVQHNGLVTGAAALPLQTLYEGRPQPAVAETAAKDLYRRRSADAIFE